MKELLILRCDKIRFQEVCKAAETEINQFLKAFTQSQTPKKRFAQYRCVLKKNFPSVHYGESLDYFSKLTKQGYENNHSRPVNFPFLSEEGGWLLDI